MGVTEEQTSSNEAEVTKTSLTFEDIEASITAWSVPLAARWRVKPDQYRITLTSVYKEHDVAWMSRGKVVQIILPWPQAAPTLKTTLLRLFEVIATQKWNDVWAVQLQFEAFKYKDEMKRLYRKSVGEDAAIFADLLPRSRSKPVLTVTKTITMTDPLTKISVSVDDKGGKIPEKDMEFQARVKLSRVVRAYEDSRENKEAQSERSTTSVTGIDNGTGGSYPSDQETELQVDESRSGLIIGKDGVGVRVPSVALVRLEHSPQQYKIGG